MSAAELEQAIQKLSPRDLEEFTAWFENYLADQFDRRIEADVAAGRLDHLAKKADEDFEAGRCTPL